MATLYSTDFGAETLGAVPSGWTRGIGTKYGNAEAWSITSLAGSTSGKVLSVTGGSAYKFIGVNALQGVQDVDFTIRFRQNNNNASGGIFLGAKTNTGTSFPDGLMIRPASTNLGVVVIVNNSAVSNVTTFQTQVPSIPTWTANTWLRLRVRKIGTTAWIKVWRDDTTEPTDWQHSVTHSGLNFTGTFTHGLITYQSSSHDFDTVTVADPVADAAPANSTAIYTGTDSGAASWANYTLAQEGSFNSDVRLRGISFKAGQAGNFVGKVVVYQAGTKVFQGPMTTIAVASGGLAGPTYTVPIDAELDAGVTYKIGFFQTSASTCQFRQISASGQHVHASSPAGVTWTDSTSARYFYSSSGQDAHPTTAWADQEVSWMLLTDPVSSTLDYTFTQDAPAANTAEAIAPTLNLQTSVSIDSPIADSSAGAFDPTVTAVVRQDVTVDLSAVPMAGATALAIDAVSGIGPSIPVPVATASMSAFDASVAPIDRAYTDFSDYPANQSPVGWTTAGTAVVVDDATGDGGRSLRLTGATGNLGSTSTWNLVGSNAGGNFLTRIRNLPLNTRAGVLFGGGWVAELLASSGTVRVQLTVAGNVSQGVGDLYNDTGIAYNASTWYWTRVEIKDSYVRIRVWADGTPEPSTWTLERYAPTQAQQSGVSGVSVRGGGAVHTYFDSLEYTGSVSTVPTTKVVLRSQVLPLIQKNLGLRWATTRSVDKTVELEWGMGEELPVEATTVALSWKTVQTVQATSVLRWETLKEQVVSRAIRWIFSAPVDVVTRMFKWQVKSTVETRTTALRWGVVVTVDEPTITELVWDNITAVQTSVSARWRTQSEGRVVSSLRTRWDSLVTRAATLRTRWSAAIESWGTVVEDFADMPLGPLEPGHGWKLVHLPERAPQGENNWSLDAAWVGVEDLYASGKWAVAEEPFAFGSKYVESVIPATQWNSNPSYTSAGPVMFFQGEPDPWEHDVVARVRPRYGINAQQVVGKFEIAVRKTKMRPVMEPTGTRLLEVAEDKGYIITLDPNGVQLSYRGPNFTESSQYLARPTTGWQWVRIQVRRDMINRITQAKLKVWGDGEHEPKNWTHSITLNTIESFPTDSNGQPILSGYTGQVVTYARGIDVDRASWVTPSTQVLVTNPAGATFGANPSAVALRSTVQADPIRMRVDTPPVTVDLGDQVIVSWFVLEMPAAVVVVEQVLVDDPATATVGVPTPAVTAQMRYQATVDLMTNLSVTAPAPVVQGAIGVRVELDAGTPATVAGFNPTVRSVRHVTEFSPVLTAEASALAPELDTEFNARIDAPIASATAKAFKPDSINGSREVEIDAVARAGASMIPVQAVIATLEIDVDNATLAQAQMLPAVARTGWRVSVDNTPQVNASGYAPEVRTSIRISAPAAAATFRARDTAATRTVTRFSVGVTALAGARMLEPAVQTFIRREDAIITGMSAFSLFRAVAPEFLTTPAEVGDALVLLLGSTVGEVRLGRRTADVSLGSTHGTVELSDVRDEEKV